MAVVMAVIAVTAVLIPRTAETVRIFRSGAGHLQVLLQQAPTLLFRARAAIRIAKPIVSESNEIFMAMVIAKSYCTFEAMFPM